MIFDEKYFLLGLCFIAMLITFSGIKIIQNKIFGLLVNANSMKSHLFFIKNA